ncbi:MULTISPECIES: PilZ domain-containing protein [unclassified Pseudomonas]|uniref:PilZ domain-containing protein n=1 Tax=unclassified Pseudomonas TaxID=196821 RepID=UPI0006D44535|nr:MULTISPECIES: PilZ domain-containing protein [unclassified Pseudomonas]
MQADALLTQDELEFIQNMQHSPQLNLADPTSSLLVNGDPDIQSLLTRLVASKQVTLQAQFNNQQISFPLQLVEDEFHAVHLQIGSPEIYEDGPAQRAWRLSMDQPSALLNAQGHASGLLVRDISFKGALVEIRGPSEAPARFDLRFAPGGIAPIELHGRLRRRIGPDLAAYDLSRSPADEIERLRQYILRAHRQAHPELHAQP